MGRSYGREDRCRESTGKEVMRRADEGGSAPLIPANVKVLHRSERVPESLVLSRKSPQALILVY